MPKKSPVAVVMGSDSDWAVMSETVKLLKTFGVGCTAEVISAHRTPDRARAWAASAEERGVRVVIAAAGGAAHLAGALAAGTTLPVIGVPLVGWALDGLDALLSTAQMPGGVPVAAVSIGKAGAKNAAVLAVEILALSNAGLRKKLKEYREKMAAEVSEKSARISAEAEGLTGV
jgi:phosphoribosylaminoimidazole carboxylase PurE protein